MFSGIITHIGHVAKTQKEGGGVRLTLKTAFSEPLETGESVAVNGVCLTVEKYDPQGNAVFWLSPETLSHSALGRLREKAPVNLERALAVNGRLSGHIVQGHVDGTAVLLRAEKKGDAHEIWLFLPRPLRRYIVPKGSVCLDGVSLTVNKITDHQHYEGEEGFIFSVMLIPHTWQNTGFHTLALFDRLNVETDILGRYVETLLQFPASPHTPSPLPKGEGK